MEAKRDDAVFDQFLTVSAALTGFDTARLLATGQARTYYEHLRAVVGGDTVVHLCSVGANAASWEGDTDRELELRVMRDAELGPVARRLIVLWYVGAWEQLDADWRSRNGASPLDTTQILTPETYTEGLVWPAIRAHPQGAKPGGYGSWAAAPRGHDDD